MAGEPRKVAVLIKGSLECKDMFNETIKAIHDYTDPRNLWVIAGRHLPYNTHSAEQFGKEMPEIDPVSFVDSPDIREPNFYIAEGEKTPIVTPTNGTIQLVEPGWAKPTPDFDLLWSSAARYFGDKEIYKIGVGLPGLGKDGARAMFPVTFYREGESIILDPREVVNADIYARGMPYSDYYVLREGFFSDVHKIADFDQLTSRVNEIPLPVQWPGHTLTNPLADPDELENIDGRVTLTDPENLAVIVTNHIKRIRRT